MKVKHEQSSRPPQAPDVERKLQLHLLQMIGVPFILLVPLLALFGVFGEMHKSGLERLSQVKWAILETDGKISIVPYESETQAKGDQPDEKSPT